MMSMDTSHGSSPGRFVPAELCACIIESGVLTQRNLHALVSVSRSFWQESERWLYKRPILWDKAKIKGFCTTVLRRPHLAERINRAIFCMPPQTDFQVADLSRITRTLHLAVNLQYLFILREGERDMRRQYPGKGEALQTWILEDHKFKLKMFTNTYFDQKALQAFFRSQPEIEILGMNCDGKADLQGVPLPKLNSLSCSVAVMQELCITAPGHRRKIGILILRNINSSREADMRMIEDLIHFRGTLYQLEISKCTTSGEPGMDIHELVTAAAARSLPALKILQVTDSRYMVSIFSLCLCPLLPSKLILIRLSNCFLGRNFQRSLR